MTSTSGVLERGDVFSVRNGFLQLASGRTGPNESRRRDVDDKVRPSLRGREGRRGGDLDGSFGGPSFSFVDGVSVASGPEDGRVLCTLCPPPPPPVSDRGHRDPWSLGERTTVRGRTTPGGWRLNGSLWHWALRGKREQKSCVGLYLRCPVSCFPHGLGPTVTVSCPVGSSKHRTNPVTVWVGPRSTTGVCRPRSVPVERDSPVVSLALVGWS